MQARGGGVHGAGKGRWCCIEEKGREGKKAKNLCIGGSARNARWGLGGVCFKGGVGFFLFTPPFLKKKKIYSGYPFPQDPDLFDNLF